MDFGERGVKRIGFATLSQQGVDAAGLLVRGAAGRNRAAFPGVISRLGAGADDGVKQGVGRVFARFCAKTAQKTPSIVKKKFREPQVTDDIPGTRA